MRVVSWNIHQLDKAWTELACDPTIDVALLQEARRPPTAFTREVFPARDDAWTMPGYKREFRTAVAALSDRVTVRGRRLGELGSLSSEAIAVSRAGTLTVADVDFGGETFTCISAYSVWESVASESVKPWIISDASAHRLISDISILIASQKGHRIIVAGDFNLLRGHGDHGSEYWARRYATVFDRMEALGLPCVGPSAPAGGRQADPWPNELPRTSNNVPTFHASQQSPATATRQLDFVFASESIASRVHTRAMNGVDEWGPSDHCRIVIDIDPR